MTAFEFISSGMGHADYRRRADGRRFRVELADPLRLPRPTDGTTIDAEVWQEWHDFRQADRAEFLAWCNRHDFELHAILATVAQGWPDLEPIAPELELELLAAAERTR